MIGDASRFILGILFLLFGSWLTYTGLTSKFDKNQDEIKYLEGTLINYNSLEHQRKGGNAETYYHFYLKVTGDKIDTIHFVVSGITADAFNVEAFESNVNIGEPISIGIDAARYEESGKHYNAEQISKGEMIFIDMTVLNNAKGSNMNKIVFFGLPMLLFGLFLLGYSLFVMIFSNKK